MKIPKQSSLQKGSCYSTGVGLTYLQEGNMASSQASDQASPTSPASEAGPGINTLEAMSPATRQVES
jgi:hypothetical protein